MFFPINDITWQTSYCDFKSHFRKQCGPRSDCSSRSSLIRVHTVYLYAKNRFENFARIFSRRHKQTTFSDAGFLGILRVNSLPYLPQNLKKSIIKAGGGGGGEGVVTSYIWHSTDVRAE